MQTVTVKERPILMNAVMVRALLDGRKTMTRRIVKSQELVEWDEETGDLIHVHSLQCPNYCDYACHRPCPFGKVGDRLWVMEIFNALCDPGAKKRDVKRKVWNKEEQETEYWVVDYKADGPHARVMDIAGCRKWQPSIHMPRWASRITLEITGVKVERLQDITDEDAIAEGCPGFYSPAYVAGGEVVGPDGQDPIEQFSELWNSIHGPNAWDANPWVFVIEFKKV